MRGADGTLMLAPASTGKYSVEKWLLADGDAREASAIGEPGAFVAILSAASEPSRERPWRSSATLRPLPTIAAARTS